MFKNRQTIFLRCPHCEAFKVDLVIVQVYAWKRFLRIFYKEMSLNVHVQPKQEEKPIRNNYQFGIFFFLTLVNKIVGFFLLLYLVTLFTEASTKETSWFVVFLWSHINNVPLHKKWSFPLRISSANVTKSEGNWGFGVTKSEEILNGKFHFLCAVLHAYMHISILLKLSLSPKSSY